MIAQQLTVRIIHDSRVGLHEGHPDSLQEREQIDLQPLRVRFVEPWTHFQDRRARDESDLDPRRGDTARCNRRPETSKTASDNDDAVRPPGHPPTVSPCDLDGEGPVRVYTTDRLNQRTGRRCRSNRFSIASLLGGGLSTPEHEIRRGRIAIRHRRRRIPARDFPVDSDFPLTRLPLSLARIRSAYVRYVIAWRSIATLHVASGHVERFRPLSQGQPTKLLIDTLAPSRFRGILLGAFAFLALVLAAVGIYGVMAYAVSQRTSEIGIRMALGARREQVLLAIVGRAFKLSSTGAAIGSIASLVLTRFLANLLYGVKATDPLTFAATAGCLIVVALAASYLPARSAASIDPVQALRKE
jgi:hypothetical protein